MNKLFIKAATLVAMTLSVAACYSRVDTIPVASMPSAVVVPPTQTTVVSPGGVVVKPY